MPDVTVPATPVLATVPNVELIHAGSWNISTGKWDVTTGDLLAAVGAQDCPAVRRPVLKLGHTDPRFDGEPAVGWVANMAVADGGLTLVGDFTGMPAWLATIAASAYPDRSVEGLYDYVCQLGHTHPFVLTAVALLGVTEPGVGTLQSLQDVAALYGVAAKTAPNPRSITVLAKGAPMPAPRGRAVAAAVTTEDIRREYYETAPWSVWIVEQQIEPLQLIVQDDEDGTFARVPVTVGADDSITFAPGVNVKRVYVDAPPEVEDEVVASRPVVFASRAESRPGPRPVTASTQSPTTVPVVGSQKGAGMDPAKLREALDLPVDASDIEVQAAIAAAGLVTPAEAPAPATETEVLTVAASTSASTEPWREELAKATTALAEIRAERATERKTNVFNDAVKAGKITPAERGAWEKRYDMAPEVITEILAATAPGTAVPVSASGYTGGDTPESDDDAFYASMFGEKKEA